jgi:UDP-N-acetylglucosamine 1-carboxyvinyltransferase
LKGAQIQSPDIRAGLSYVFAAAIADGESKVGGANLIDRGYESIEKRLTAIGLNIVRV